MGHRESPAALVAPIVGGLLLLVTILGLVGTAVSDPKPHDIAVGLVGPPPATQQISTAFATNAPGTFDFTTYNTEADARAAIDSRAVDGALILSAGPPVLVVAGAAGDAAVGIMTAAFTNVFQAQSVTLQVQTVHPFAPGDAHGLILFFVVVAVVVSTLVSQAILYTIAGRAGLAARAAVVAAYAVFSGLAAMGVALWIVGDFGTGFWPATALVMIGSAAVGAAVAGIIRVFGRIGVALSVLIVVLLDLVSSGGPGGSQLLPDYYRVLSPWMPAPQLFSAMRGALYFNGEGVITPMLVLFGWIAGGVVLMVLGHTVASRRGANRSEPAPAPATAPATATEP
jgi:hypothetical protein